MRKVDPTLGRLSTMTVPPMRSASSRQIARPSPLPPKRRVVDSSAWVKGSKIFSMVAASIPMPVSLTAISSSARPASAGIDIGLDDDFALNGELDGVAHEIHHDLANPQRIAEQRVGEARRRRHDELDALGLGGSRE